jgi:hypothetical protein
VIRESLPPAEICGIAQQASELEHSLACQYLFTAFSLKEGADEGITSVQRSKIADWQRWIVEIAVQEMLHLALAGNLLTAIGGAIPAGPTSSGQDLHVIEPALCPAPFNEDTLTRICFERRKISAWRPARPTEQGLCGDQGAP